MSLNFFNLGGYGVFVWPAFVFTFVSCLLLYLETKKVLQKQERIFLEEYKKLQRSEIKVFEKEKKTKEVLSGNTI